MACCLVLAQLTIFLSTSSRRQTSATTDHNSFASEKGAESRRIQVRFQFKLLVLCFISGLIMLEIKQVCEVAQSFVLLHELVQHCACIHSRRDIQKLSENKLLGYSYSLHWHFCKFQLLYFCLSKFRLFSYVYGAFTLLSCGLKVRPYWQTAALFDRSNDKTQAKEKKAMRKNGCKSASTQAMTSRCITYSQTPLQRSSGIWGKRYIVIVNLLIKAWTKKCTL